MSDLRDAPANIRDITDHVACMILSQAGLNFEGILPNSFWEAKTLKFTMALMGTFSVLAMILGDPSTNIRDIVGT